MTPTPPTSAPAEHPELALAPALLATLRERPGLAIASIAGRDSIAAAVAAVRERGFTSLLPTVALTATEFGDFEAPVRAVDILRQHLQNEAEVPDPLVWLSSPNLWNALNARFATELAARFGSWSPCSACHLYVHLCRLRLSWALGGKPIITGERDAHRGKVKLSQTPESIGAEIAVFAHAGVELLTPIRHVDDDAEIDALVGPRWERGGGQLGCVLSGNYLDAQGCVRYDPAEQRRYVDEFLLPAGMAVVDAWRDTAEPDYAGIVRKVVTEGHR